MTGEDVVADFKTIADLLIAADRAIEHGGEHIDKYEALKKEFMS